MCTLAITLHADRRWPIVVAANRDERLGRAAEGWAVREPATGPRYLAPRDLVAGGTWIGLSARGVFAALTNFHAGGRFPDPARRSRGELVSRALSHEDAASAHLAFQGADAALYNPFHLVVADARCGFLWRYDGETTRIAMLEPGLHVLTETEYEARSPRADRVRARWPLEPDPLLLREVLVQHASSPREGTCIHLDPHYGTRSAAILRLASTLETSSLLVADGRPCTTPFEDRSSLLATLAGFA